MELSKETNEELMVLYNKYLDTLADRAYMKEILEIISNDENFKGSLLFNFDTKNKIPCYTDLLTGKITVNSIRIFKTISEYVNLTLKVYPDIDETLLRNYFIMHVLLHESVHAKQVYDVYKHTYKSEEVMRQYKLLFDYLNNKPNSFYSFLIRFMGSSSFHERNAEIMTNLNLACAFEGTEFENIATWRYLASLFDGYKNNTCPVKSTLKRISIPYGVDMRGLTFRESLYNGLNVDHEKYNKIISYTNNYEIEELSVKKIDEKIRSLG